MAFSATRKRITVMGNLKAEVWEFNSAGVTTGSFSAGLGVVDHCEVNNEVTANTGKVARSGSLITLTGLTSGDTGTILVVGI